MITWFHITLALWAAVVGFFAGALATYLYHWYQDTKELSTYEQAAKQRFADQESEDLE